MKVVNKTNDNEIKRAAQTITKYSLLNLIEVLLARHISTTETINPPSDMSWQAEILPFNIKLCTCLALYFIINISEIID